MEHCDSRLRGKGLSKRQKVCLLKCNLGMFRAFFDDMRAIFERFECAAQMDRLGRSGLPYRVVE